MAITTRKTAMTVFSARELSLKDMDTKALEELLRTFSFTPIDSTPDRRSIGWTGAHDINDYTFELDTIARADNYIWALRIDTKNIPGSTLNNELNIAIKNELQRTGRDFLSRDRKKELKEQVIMRLRTKMTPTPKTIQVVYDQTSNMIFVGTTSNAELEIFEDLAATTFDGNIIRLTADVMAEDILDGDPNEVLREIARTSVGDINYAIMTGFLTWLWCKSDTLAGKELPLEPGAFSFVIDNDIVIDDYTDSKISSTITVKTKDEHYNFYDLKYGMWKSQRGVRKLTLVVNHGEDKYLITLDATKSAAVTVKTPNIRLNGESVLNESPFLEKLYFIDITRKFLNAVFDIYINARTSDRWEREREHIYQWLMASAPECEQEK